LICREFQSRPLPFVVVEKDPHLITLGEQPAINQLEKLAAGYQP
jgi:hypothetical protein